MTESTIPDHVKKPQDKKEKTAAQVEADGDATVEVEWRDFNFEVPASVDDWPLEAIQAYEVDRGTEFLRHLLGTKQWVAFVATKPKGRDVNSLTKAIQDRAGYGQGE